MQSLPPTRLAARAALACALCFQTGCITHNLWEQTTFSPALPPRIQLYESKEPPGILVEYDERIAGGGRTGRRAYLLETSAGLPRGTPPPFVAPHGQLTGLKEIPILKPSPDGTSPILPGRVATAWPAENEFTLFCDGRIEGTWRLPYYSRTSHPLQRALLTPLSVAVDTAIFSTVPLTCGASALLIENATPYRDFTVLP